LVCIDADFLARRVDRQAMAKGELRKDMWGGVGARFGQAVLHVASRHDIVGAAEDITGVGDELQRTTQFHGFTDVSPKRFATGNIGRAGAADAKQRQKEQQPEGHGRLQKQHRSAASVRRKAPTEPVSDNRCVPGENPLDRFRAHERCRSHSKSANQAMALMNRINVECGIFEVWLALVYKMRETCLRN
jgi:hypothetical protein